MVRIHMRTYATTNTHAHTCTHICTSTHLHLYTGPCVHAFIPAYMLFTGTSLNTHTCTSEFCRHCEQCRHQDDRLSAACIKTDQTLMCVCHSMRMREDEHHAARDNRGCGVGACNPTTWIPQTQDTSSKVFTSTLPFQEDTHLTSCPEVHPDLYSVTVGIVFSHRAGLRATLHIMSRHFDVRQSCCQCQFLEHSFL